ncbi:hypothetical protein RN001_005032 [Aquatica leii]|uniref:Uncharacterized protein n=1 Tax=Aquatica leii TaxID=1421715 RepID=A0AAN7SPQ9_9COLE|nr:hypothetical protein RN001_005032 [Aquatica leii]
MIFKFLSPNDEDTLTHKKATTNKEMYHYFFVCCWSKNEVFKFQLVNSIVLAPAITGRDSSNKMAVIKTAHTNTGKRSKVIPICGILIIVENLRHFNLRRFLLRGYTVQPVLAPFSTNLLINNRDNEGGRSQNLILFIRGKAIAGAPNINGTNQLLNPPIIIDQNTCHYNNVLNNLYIFG